jgi:hypothetical protein
MQMHQLYGNAQNCLQELWQMPLLQKDNEFQGLLFILRLQ